MTARQAWIGGLAFVVLVGGWGREVHAQESAYFGLLTPSVGVASGGDRSGSGWTPGVSVGVFDGSGWGAEADVAWVPDFASVRLADTSAVPFMLNAAWTMPKGRLRPYAVGGFGVIRTHGCRDACRATLTHWDWGVDAGGGILVTVREFLFVRGDVRYYRALQHHPDLGLRGGGRLDFWRTSVGVTLWWRATG